MPLPTAAVGAETAPRTHRVDERWLMAYAAGLGDHHDLYLDTRSAAGVAGHPLFSVCVEWDSILDLRALPALGAMLPDENLRGVHASHDVVIHRLARPGDELTVSARIAGIERKRSGTFLTMLITTADQHGEVLFETQQGSMYLNVESEGADQPVADPRPSLAYDHVGDPTVTVIPLERGAAHVYTECARIWNPIHTDVAVADKAGLPDIILHGTATLAHGITQSLRAAGDIDPADVSRIVGQFRNMVLMPSDVAVHTWPLLDTELGRVVPFEVHTAEGTPAVDKGALLLNS